MRARLNSPKVILADEPTVTLIPKLLMKLTAPVQISKEYGTTVVAAARLQGVNKFPPALRTEKEKVLDNAIYLFYNGVAVSDYYIDSVIFPCATADREK